MDLISFLWDLTQQLEINEHDRQFAKVESGMDTAYKQIRELRAHTIHLGCTCQILCNLLIEKLGVQEAELKTLIQQSIAKAIQASGECAACGHRFHPTWTACLYCGYKPQAMTDKVLPTPD